MSVGSRAAKGKGGTTSGPRVDTARPRMIAEPGETTVGVGEQLPRLPSLLRTWAPGGDSPRCQPGAQPSVALLRAFEPSPLQGGGP